MTTLFRRLVVAQTIGATALLLVFAGAFYVERNRTVARLTAQRWAPALRAAAGLGEPVPGAPGPVEVRVSTQRPEDAIPSNAWAPRITTLRTILREDGVPAGEVVFTRGTPRPVTWIEVTGADGQVRWLGIGDDMVESYVVGRLAAAMILGFAVVAAASWALARRLTRPLEALRPVLGLLVSPLPLRRLLGPSEGLEGYLPDWLQGPGPVGASWHSWQPSALWP